MSPAKTAEAIEMPFASGLGLRETPVAYNRPLRANTVLCLFNTVQLSSFILCIHLSISSKLINLYQNHL